MYIIIILKTQCIIFLEVPFQLDKLTRSKN